MKKLCGLFLVFSYGLLLAADVTRKVTQEATLDCDDSGDEYCYEKTTTRTIKMSTTSLLSPVVSGVSDARLLPTNVVKLQYTRYPFNISTLQWNEMVRTAERERLTEQKTEGFDSVDLSFYNESEEECNRDNSQTLGSVVATYEDSQNSSDDDTNSSSEILFSDDMQSKTRGPLFPVLINSYPPFQQQLELEKKVTENILKQFTCKDTVIVEKMTREKKTQYLKEIDPSLLEKAAFVASGTLNGDCNLTLSFYDKEGKLLERIASIADEQFVLLFREISLS